MPEEKFERNQELYQDHKNGMLGVDMVAKYRISSARIYKIIEIMDKKKQIVDNVVKTE